MKLKSMKTCDIAIRYILVAIVFQIARVQFGDGIFLSILNQLAFAVFILFSIIFVPRIYQFKTPVLIFCCHFVLLLIIAYHAFCGSNLMALTLGHFDNLKFLLPLSLFLIIPQKNWDIGKKGRKTLFFVWTIIVVGVFVGFVQQLFPSTIGLVSSKEEFVELYRYGLLRVPSFFSEINAFARISWLLIPISVILDRKVVLSVFFAFFGILLSFSRQFILGSILSILLSYFIVLNRRSPEFIRILIISSVCFFAYLCLSFSNVTLFKSGADDKLFSVSERYIRTAVAKTSIVLIKDRPIFGVGPGHFGGNIGKKFGITEYLYGYGLLKIVPYFDLQGVHYTDTLWPQLIAEYGVFGFLSIITLFILWYKKIVLISDLRIRFVCLVCFFQFIFSGIASPVFNFLYYSISTLVFTFILSALDRNKPKTSIS